MSTPYESDDLTWCIQRATKIPAYLRFMLIASPGSWILAIAMGYVCGFLLLVMMQFDKEYKQRNNRDWHYTTWLVTLPAFIGLSPSFYPKGGSIRIFYGVYLIFSIFCFQVVFCYWLDFLKLEMPRHQISTINEIFDNNFRLMGTQDVYNTIIAVNEKVKLMYYVL